MNDSTLSISLNGVKIPQDILLSILRRLEKEFRLSDPQKWARLKLVCKTFNEAIGRIEDKDKYFFYNNVAYPNFAQVVGEANDDKKPQYKILKFSFHADKKIIAVQQLGRQSNHYWAPLLTCDETFKLKLYELNAKDAVCEYTQHTAALTVAISVGNYIVSADESGCVGIWPMQSAKAHKKSLNPFQYFKATKKTHVNAVTGIRHFKAHDKAITAIDYLSRSQFVTGSGSEVKFWDINQVDPIKSLTCDGNVKAIHAKSADELLILTHKSTWDFPDRMILTYYSNDKPLPGYTLVLSWNEKTFQFSNCDEVRIVSMNKLVGFKRNPTDKSFGSLEFKDPSNTRTEGIISRCNGVESLSRAQYCMFFSQNKNHDLEVTLSLEPSEKSLRTYIDFDPNGM